MSSQNAFGSFEVGQNLICLDPLGTHGKLINCGWYRIAKVHQVNTILPNTGVFKDYSYIDSKIPQSPYEFEGIELESLPGHLFAASRFKLMETVDGMIANGEIRRVQ